MSGAPRKASSATAAQPAATNTQQDLERSDAQLESEKARNRMKHWEATLNCANKRYDELVAFDLVTTKPDIFRILRYDAEPTTVRRIPRLGVNRGDQALDQVQVVPLDGRHMEALEERHRFRIITVMYDNDERDASLLILRHSAAARAS